MFFMNVESIAVAKMGLKTLFGAGGFPYQLYH